MEEKLNGIVLGGISYGDFDKILSIFTLEKGTVSAKIKGVKKAGAKLKFASEPFCFAEFIFLKSGDKRTVKTASLFDSYYPIREDLVKYYAGATAVEFIKKFQREEMVSPKLFMALAETLKTLAYEDISPKYTIAKFLYNALKNTGFALNFGDCAGCGGKVGVRPFFDADTSSFYCEECRTDNAREIKHSTYLELKSLEDEEVLDGDYMGALKLMDFYMGEKTDETIVSLKELINL